jgi:elongation factor Ts
MEVTATMVKTLREQTGLPMMDCKKALTATGGDSEKAIQHLREQGQIKGEKMKDREAGEGRIAIHVDAANKVAGIVELRCETAPVANTDDFTQLANAIAATVAAAEAPTADNLRDTPLAGNAARKVGDAIGEVFNRLRENIQIARVEKVTGSVGQYVHFDGQKGTLVEFNADCPEELGAGVCMHVTAMNPPAATRNDVDDSKVAEQRAGFEKEAAGKPPEIAAKIVEGKLGRWYSEFVLLDQPFVKDDKKSVAQALKEVNPDLTIKRFVRYEVGGL